MTAVQAEAFTGYGRPFDTLLPGDRIVWVVGVQGYRPRDSAPYAAAPLTRKQLASLRKYTVVLDAPTGFIIVTATATDPFLNQ